jgi:rhamnosyl/mannosyltransferase
MKILQIGKYYPPVHGGMETVLKDSCQGLINADCQVTVIVSADSSDGSTEQIGQGSTLIRCPRLTTFLSQPLNYTLPSVVRKTVADFKPDIIQIHLPNPLANIALQMSGVFGDIPVAVWYHADITRQKISRIIYRPLLNKLLGKCAGISVSTRSLLNQSTVLKAYEEKVKVIPFGIDISGFPVGRAAGIGPLLFVGRLVYYKGIEVLLEVVARIPEAELVIVGDGPLKEQLKRKISKSGLSERVQLLGDISNTKLKSVMNNAGALVLPSTHKSETFGLVQLEAMASSIPVISTNLPTGVATVNIDNETGFVVTPGDVPELTEAIIKLYQDSQNACELGRNGRTRVEQYFSREVMAQNLIAWYTELIEKRK